MKYPLLRLSQLELTMIGDEWIFRIWWLYWTRGYQMKVSRLWNLVLTIWSINRVTYIFLAKLILSFDFLNEQVRRRLVPPNISGVPTLCCLQNTLCCSNLFDKTLQIHQLIGNNDRMLWIKVNTRFNIPPRVFTMQLPVCL
jgi:hypothetical protein